MARSRSGSNGNGKLDKLDEAMTSLVRAQAQLVEVQDITQAQIAEAQRRQAEYERQSAETFAKIEQRFTRIETILLEHSRILAEHSRILQALPDAVREKIGFRPRQQG